MGSRGTVPGVKCSKKSTLNAIKIIDVGPRRKRAGGTSFNLFLQRLIAAKCSTTFGLRIISAYILCGIISILLFFKLRICSRGIEGSSLGCFTSDSKSRIPFPERSTRVARLLVELPMNGTSALWAGSECWAAPTLTSFVSSPTLGSLFT